MLKYWQRRPESAEVREWLGDSAVKTCVFHRTTSDFEVFDTSRGDLGTHFGPLQLVNTLPRFEAADGEVMPGDRIIPAWLRMRRPLRLRDEGSFHADGIAIQLAQKGLLSMKQAREIFSECDANFRARKHHDPYLLALIKNAGYDGVSYLSVWDRVRGGCFIAFESTQICPAFVARDGLFQDEYHAMRERMR